MTSLGARRYGGNWSSYREQKAIELAAVRHDLAHAEKHLAEIDGKAQEAAERKARKDSGGRKKRAKGDMPRILAGARKDRSEDSGGKTTQIAERRRAEALEAVDTARRRVEILPAAVGQAAPDRPAGGQGGGMARSRQRRLSAGAAGPARSLTHARRPGARRGRRAEWFRQDDVTQARHRRVAPVRGHRAGQAGLRAVRPEGQPARSRDLDPATISGVSTRKRDENECHAALARFMFRADAAAQIVGSLSGGQLFRAGLACVLGGAGAAVPAHPGRADQPSRHRVRSKPSRQA